MSDRQVYKLMKMDSYQRFLKSDIYKQFMLADMEGRPLPHTSPVEASKLTLFEAADADSKVCSHSKGFVNCRRILLFLFVVSFVCVM